MVDPVLFRRHQHLNIKPRAGWLVPVRPHDLRGTRQEVKRYRRSDSQKEAHMSRGMPSMTALLGLLALAGYQNRDKLAELLKGATGNAQPGAGGQQGPLGGLLGNLGGALGGGGVGGLLGGGLGELLERFKQNGQGDAAESWVSKGPNKELPAPQLKQAIGADVLAALEQQTGLSQEELLARLSRELPNAVDQYTPDGRLPS
jgi:uncharacterized protein YidB (DUF937 family)